MSDPSASSAAADGRSPSWNPFDRRDLAAIAVGGVLGAALRWWISDVGTGGGYFTTVNNDPIDDGWFVYAPNTSVAIEVREPGIPWRTVTANVVGTFVLGMVLTLRRHADQLRRLWLALGTGFCGSLTTFSTMAVELAFFARGPAAAAAFATGTTAGARPDGFASVEASQESNVLMLQQAGTGRQFVVYLLVSCVGGALAFLAGRVVARRGRPQ